MRHHKNWIQAYISHTQHLEAPDSFHFWTAVSTVAGALRRRVWIPMGYFEWTPNFYIILVAKPGTVNKSTSINTGMQLLKQIDGVHFGPNATTWQALVQNMATTTEMMPLDDYTFLPMSCITIAASELGTLLNTQDREMIDVLVDLWDGRKDVWKKATKTSGNDAIENPWINIIGGTTPAWIADNMTDSMAGGGFSSRCIFIFEEKKRHLIAYPADHIPKDFASHEIELRQDLEKISQLKGEYVISPEAKAYGNKWYETHYSTNAAHLDDERFGGYIARKQTHVHKLAMVLAASQRDELIITKEDLESAVAIITALEKEMSRVFENIGQSDTSKQMKVLINTVRSHQQIERGELLRVLLKTMDLMGFTAALNGALAAGYLVQQQLGVKIIIRVGNHV